MANETLLDAAQHFHASCHRIEIDAQNLLHDLEGLLPVAGTLSREFPGDYVAYYEAARERAADCLGALRGVRGSAGAQSPTRPPLQYDPNDRPHGHDALSRGLRRAGEKAASPALSLADLAVTFLLDTIQRDVNLRLQIGPGTKAFRVLVDAEATRRGCSSEEVEVLRRLDFQPEGDRKVPDPELERRVRAMDGRLRDLEEKVFGPPTLALRQGGKGGAAS